MEPVYTQNYEIKDNMVDCFGNLRPGQILFIAQDMGHPALPGAFAEL